MNTETVCAICNKPITDIETFGDIDTPLCWSCYSSAMFDGDPENTEITADIFAADAETKQLVVVVYKPTQLQNFPIQLFLWADV